MKHQSSGVYWLAGRPLTAFPSLSGDMETDVVVVGGGIVGVTTARLLKDRGVRVILVEALRVGAQVTGQSTAKMTSQHGLIYQTLERKFGRDCAALYGEAQEAGIREIRRLAATWEVEADIEDRPAFVYTLDESYVSQIEKEAEVAQRLGLPATLTRETGLPFEVPSALRFDGQAQFQPYNYVAGLAQTLPGEGCHVFENSRVIEYDPGRVVTDAGSVAAEQVVLATHLPLGQVGGFYAENYPYAEPVIAAPIRRVPPGMYKSAEKPSRSIRTHRGPDGQVYGIVAGTSFKPGHVDEERTYFSDIERWLTENFDAGPITHRWVNQDYTPMDDAPFIGWSSAVDDQAYLVATGFAAWGISKGTAAAMVLAELATGARDHPWLEVFNASRIKPLSGGTRFLSENAKVATHLIGGYLSRKRHSYEELQPGDAAILKVGRENVAAFRDEGGHVHAVSAVCSHMGCIVGWNETDRTWDCPCHGSRFGLSGEVIHGPATLPLRPKITQ